MNTESHLKVATFLAKLLEEQFSIGKFKFGLDPILGIIPGIGDIIAFLIAYYIVWIGEDMKLPKNKINEMKRNVLFDLVLGLVPIVGDIGDVFYKANSKNLAILREYLQKNSIVEGEVVKDS